MSSQRWLVRFVAVGVSWGSSFLLIKWGLESLTPVGVAFGRQFIGALTLLGIAAVTRMPLPRRWQQLRHVAVVAFLLNAFPSFLFAQAEQHVSSVMAGMLNATTPLMAVLVIAFAFREQRITRDQLIGVVVGFVGIVLVTGVLDGAGTNNWHGIAMLLLATVCYGISYPYAQRHLTGMGFTPISISAAQVSAAAVMLLPFAILDGSVLAPPTVHAVVGMLTLGAVGTGLAYVWNLLNCTTFPMMNALMPVLAKEIYHINQTGLGYLVAAGGFGALMSSVIMSRIGHRIRPARTMILLSAGWLLSLMCFVNTPSPAYGIPFLLLAGLSQGLSQISMATMLIRSTEARFRGRTMGIRTLAIYGNVPGLLLAGFLIPRIGYPLMATLYCAVALVCVAIVTLRWRTQIWHRGARANSR